MASLQKPLIREDHIGKEETKRPFWYSANEK